MSHTNKKSRHWLKKTAWLFTELVIFIGIFMLIIWWQQKDMLSEGSTLSQTELTLIEINGKVKHHIFNNGERDTLVYFFAPWCKICDLSIDNLELLYQANYKNLDVIAIALDWKSINEVDLFLEKHELTIPVLLGNKQTQELFNISAFPSYYLISKNAEVRAKSRGYSTELGMNLSVLLKR
ncbi:TlpA family protein disulfide reductase [Aliikangiella sp. IMCC44359]|uniref:TlpA family protein disulfide reductase n=1 Tax=Aliikangiella sp. IMCC44359 TaxID=3459125 RepID=UPI00403AF187